VTALNGTTERLQQIEQKKHKPTDDAIHSSEKYSYIYTIYGWIALHC